MAGSDLMNGHMEGEIVWHKMLQVARAGGGEIEVALFTGRIDFANGETGSYAGVETVDFADAKAPFTGYRTVMLEDGSLSNQSFEGMTTFQEESGRVGGTGTWKLIDGTGRFAGLRGSGTFRWELSGEDYRETFGG
jgi:hypothetical protein